MASYGESNFLFSLYKDSYVESAVVAKKLEDAILLLSWLFRNETF